MRGLTMNHQLVLTDLLRRAEQLFPYKEVVTRTPGGLVRHGYGEIAARSRRLAGALTSLGIGAGDRIGTFAWNGHRHLELYLGVPSMGAVLHTINIRLFSEQIEYIVNHADDRVIFVDDDLVPLLEPLASRFASVRAFVLMGDGPAPETSLPNVHRYEDLLGAASRRRRSCATPPAPPAIPRASSTRTGHSSCRASRSASRTRSGSASATSSWPSFPCSTPTAGGSPTPAR
jgi:acyl-CoA synthetase (AMP-forming)/AMP-acid ligase II